MKLISYNLEKHRAAEELAELIRTTGASSLCIQEARVSELPETIEGLTLVGSTPQNRLGLAIYADLDRYHHLESFSRGFSKTLHDRIAAPAEHRLLGSVLSDKETGTLSVLASFHASPLTSLNRHRRMQIAESLRAIEAMAPNAPFIMAGDYNYPVFRGELGKALSKAGYDITFSDAGTYQKSVFKGHFDFITSRGYTIDSVKTLPQGESDHKPILIHSRGIDGKSDSLETRTIITGS